MSTTPLRASLRSMADSPSSSVSQAREALAQAMQ
jgi:hypothetical protein